MAKQLNVRERTAQGSDLFGGKGWSDEDEGSLPRGRVNWPEQVQRLAAGKIERSAEAFQVSAHLCLSPIKQVHLLQP